MSKKIIPNYEFIESWSEDQLKEFITIPSGLPSILTDIVGEIISDINTLRLCAKIEFPELENLDGDERAVTHRLLREGKYKEVRESHVQYALDFLEKYPQFKPIVTVVE